MAMSVVYTTFDGEIVHENRGGVASFYAPDTMGSTVALLNSSGVVTDTYSYWPYGEIQSHVGSSLTPFGFLGTIGYYTDVIGSFLYVRARYLRQALARWLTVDRLWPRRRAYAYCACSPVQKTDPTGLAPRTASYPPMGSPPPGPVRCGEPWNSWIYGFCNNCYYGPNPSPGCQATCNYYAGNYYNKCNSWRYPPRDPFNPLQPPPPSVFRPIPGGGVIVPQRPCPVRGGGAAPLPPTPQACIQAAGGAVDSTPPDVQACVSCCQALGASTSGCVDLYNLWAQFHIGEIGGG